MENHELEPMLNAYFNWNKCRMHCFVGMLLALIKVRTINLTELACGFASSACIYPSPMKVLENFSEIDLKYGHEISSAQ